MVNCASSNAASVMLCSLWIVCSASERISASISGSASEIAAIVLRRSGSLKGKVEAYEGLVAKYEDTHALIELANEEEDESLLEEAESEVEAVKENLEKQRLQTLLTGEYDKNNAL